MQVAADQLSKISPVIQEEITTGFHFSGELDLDDADKTEQEEK
jgi:hypothetical protein